MIEAVLSAAPTVTAEPAAAATGPVRIAVRKLDFYYGDFRALKGIDLDFHDREVTALIGPSGCGKSTLLRTFNRIYSLYPEQRATGEVILDGRNVLAPEMPVPDCLSLSLTSSHRAARRRASSTRASTSARGSRPSRRRPKATLS